MEANAATYATGLQDGGRLLKQVLSDARAARLRPGALKGRKGAFSSAERQSRFLKRALARTMATTRLRQVRVSGCSGLRTRRQGDEAAVPRWAFFCCCWFFVFVHFLPSVFYWVHRHSKSRCGLFKKRLVSITKAQLLCYNVQ